MTFKHENPKCLLVDDLNENLIALEALLKHEAVDIFKARSGQEALELLLKHDFALALVDVQMPEMDGFELAELMRSTEKTKNIPIIFVTAGSHDIQRVFQGYEAGAVDFLHKPLAPIIVLGKVRVFLQLFVQKLQLQRALAIREEFLSICSHELRTPLTSMKLQVQMTQRILERAPEDASSWDKIKKFVNATDRSVERITHLIDDMLDISKITSGQLIMQFDDFDLSEIVYEVGERIKPILNQAGCELSMTIGPSIKARVDRLRIEQVISNLLVNAAKYASKAPVHLSLRLHHHVAEISVQDEGPGITQGDQARIFDKFERARSADKVSGMGLGLYISKKIIDLHHGKILIDSSPGQGAKFTIKIPI